MKNKWLVLTLTIVILALLFLTISRQTNKPVKSGYFAVSDTSGLTRIEINSKTGSLILTRAANTWKINKGSNANIQKVHGLINVLRKIEIKSHLSGETGNRFKTDIISKGAHVKIYKGEKKILSYYFYEEYNQYINSFIFSEKKNRVYLVKATGIITPLAKYINTNVNIYKDNVLFGFLPSDIHSVKINYPQNPEKSFTLNLEKSLELIDYKGLKSESEVKNTDKYLSYFYEILYEKEIDSTDIPSNSPVRYAEIHITDKTLNSFIFTLFLIKLNKKFDNEYFDMNNTIVKNETEKRFYLVKFLEIDLLIKDYEYFR